ncbi:MAG: xanthine dehydrogenase family protein molybdopterin-binding subunit [Gammaproteobacteria bacterium]|nr:xanthine dehydrogenase family protein molybdopterin-binding subunit [Gammaproteobacteria bacterium]MDP2349339.1 xanthine dehydrogenase family protein molybdopterin-binding subunit [Gammaproteobacteria bacterium]
MTYMHIGKDFTPPDAEGKVTGAARYSEDFRRDGLVFARLLTSPVPSGMVRNIDATEALRMDGVLGILTADDLPETPRPGNPALSNELTYVGQPILAIAAISEQIAEDALGRIRLDIERRAFVVDPLDSLVEGGPNAYPEGNVMRRGESGMELAPLKWSRAAVENFRNGRDPQAEFTTEWSFGDLDAAFAECSVVIEEPFVSAGTPHHSLEPRTCMSYWENGRCYFHGSLQSQSAANAPLARMLGIELDDLCFINETTGGGFGSRIGPYPFMAISGYLSRNLNRPVQVRITREEEFFIGSARSGMQGWMKVGLKPDGKVAAVDLVIVNDGGSTGSGSGSSGAGAVTVIYQPNAMRFRGVSVFTNTTPRGAQRGPGQNEMHAITAPIMDKAANQLGMDRVAFRRANAPDSNSRIEANQTNMTSAFMREAIDMGAQMFDWEGKINQPRRNGSKVIGIGVGQGYHAAGNNGFDGIVRIGTDGRIYLHTGVGNLGTYSYAGTVRAAAEALQCRWENCEIVRGNSDLGLPHSSGQGGSNTMFTHTRTNWVAAMDAIAKMKEIAAAELGGTVDDYSIGEERVFKTATPAEGLTYAEAAQRAVALGGRYSGAEYPDDINELTALAVQKIAGTGLIGVAKDNLEKNGTAPGLAVAFAEIEMDLDTGKYEILDYVGIAECGTIVHPKGLSQGMNGGGVWGFGMAGHERHVYDPQNGLPANIGLYQSKPPTFLDVPLQMRTAAVNIPDPQSPVGARGIGEPAQGCAVAAVTSAIADALGGHLFNRVPVTPDMVIDYVAGNTYNNKSLKTNTF